MIRAVALLWLAALLSGCTEPDRAPEQREIYERVVTLAPNLTELVFAVGAGESLVGVSAWSDYPKEATELPIVGDAFTVDREQLTLLEPDLLLVWESGMPTHTVDELRATGLNVEVIRTRGLADVAAAMRRIGAMTGYDVTAANAADEYLRRLEELRGEYSDAEPIRVFFQVARRPLYTVNREHYVSELIEVCGGRNVFHDLTELAPTISVEAVVHRAPEVMLASTDAGDDAFAEWQRWSMIPANRYGNQFLLPADELARATPRLILAGRALCLALEQARNNRAAVAD